MKTLSRHDRLYPCGHGMAQFGEMSADTVAPRRCNTCKTKYVVSFIPATSHVVALTGREVYRAVWREA